MEDNRKHHRHIAWFPARIERSHAVTRLGITHNISQGGALIVCNSTWSEGDVVTMTLRVPGSFEEKTVAGRVVRVELNTEDPDGAFPHKIAIQFDETMPELESVMEKSQSGFPDEPEEK